MHRNATARPATNVRAEILDAATRRFAACGYDGVALQEIADDVSIKKPSLLYHFRSKERLREAVLQSLIDHWVEVLPRLLNSAMSGSRRLDAVMNEAVAYFAGAPYRARLLLREMLDHPDDLRTRLGKQLGPWLLLIADYVRRGQRERTVHPDLDADAYVFHVMHLLLASVAVGDVTVGLYAGKQSHARATERHLRELVRLAKAGLFLPSSDHQPEDDHA